MKAKEVFDNITTHLGLSHQERLLMEAKYGSPANIKSAELLAYLGRANKPTSRHLIEGWVYQYNAVGVGSTREVSEVDLIKS